MQLGVKGGVVVVVVQLHAIRGVLAGVLKRAVHEILTDRLCPVGFAQLVAAVRHGFVHNVPRDNQPRIILVRPRQHLLDVAFHAGEHGFAAAQRLVGRVALMEEGFGRLGVPHQHMPMHLHAIVAAPIEERNAVVELHSDGRVVRAAELAAFRHVQQRIRLHLVSRGHDGELAAVERHAFAVRHFTGNNRRAEIELIRIERFEDRQRSGVEGVNLLVAGEIADGEGRFLARALNVQHILVIPTGNVRAGQHCPFALLRRAGDNVLIGFLAVAGMGDGQDEAARIHLVLLHLHGQVVGAPRHKVEVAAGRVPRRGTPGDVQPVSGRLDGSTARRARIPAVRAAGKVRRVVNLRRVGVIHLFGRGDGQRNVIKAVVFAQIVIRRREEADVDARVRLEIAGDFRPLLALDVHLRVVGVIAARLANRHNAVLRAFDVDAGGQVDFRAGLDAKRRSGEVNGVPVIAAASRNSQALLTAMCLRFRHADGAGARLAECGGVAILKVDGDGGLRGFFRCGEAGQKQAECHQQRKRLCDPVFHV